MSTSETPIRDYMRQLGQVYNEKTVPVTMPTTMYGDKFVNIQQSELVTEGPQKGHWADVNGKRTWIEGQHCYPRQQNPKNNEHINETKILNKNIKAVPLENNGDLAGTDATARDKPIITRYAKTYRKVKGDYWDYVAAMAIKDAQEKLAKKALVAGEYV